MSIWINTGCMLHCGFMLVMCGVFLTVIDNHNSFLHTFTAIICALGGLFIFIIGIVSSKVLSKSEGAQNEKYI